MKFQPRGMFGGRKKDIAVAVGTERLKYFLIIDGTESYTILGQEKKLLRINGRSATDMLFDCLKVPCDQSVTLDISLDHDSFYTLNKLFYAAGLLKDLYDTYCSVGENRGSNRYYVGKTWF
jgi:hypothetical protein